MADAAEGLSAASVVVLEIIGRGDLFVLGV
jgi:hypothetical protein